MSIKDFRTKPFSAVRAVRSSISRANSEDDLSDVGSLVSVGRERERKRKRKRKRKRRRRRRKKQKEKERERAR